MQEPQKILAKLGLTPSETAAYLAMLGGSRSVRDIMRVTRQKRPTVYYALTRLQERGLVRKTGSGDERFAPEPPERLGTVVERQQKEINALAAEVKAFIPSLVKKTKTRSPGPHVAFYEGIDAVKNIIMETLYCKSRHIDSIAPSDNFFWQVGQDFAAAYVEERARRGIKTRNLWERPIDKAILKQNYAGRSDIRILPKVMHGQFVTTTFLYDDRVLSISSLDNAYALLVTSEEHHATMKAMFDGLWVGSTPLS